MKQCLLCDLLKFKKLKSLKEGFVKYAAGTDDLVSESKITIIPSQL